MDSIKVEGRRSKVESPDQYRARKEAAFGDTLGRDSYLVPTFSRIPIVRSIGSGGRREGIPAIVGARRDSRTSRIVWRGLCGAIIVLLCSASVLASDAPRTPAAPSRDTAPKLQTAVEAGLSWLASHQEEDGSYGNLSHYGPHVGITGLAGLAFLSDGNTCDRGRYGVQVDRCLAFILAHRSESGLLAAETSHGPMYGHGFATLFLAEVYGMTNRPEVRETLRRAIRLITNTQNEEGGWRYQPVRNDADLSVTVCQVMALRAARNTGIYIDRTIIDHAIEYIKRSQNPDGGFRYMLSSGGSAFARSAAGVAALQYAGIYSGDEVERGLEYIRRFVPPQERTVGHFFYGHYYAAQAMFLAGEKKWPDWWNAVRKELIEKQAPEGFWRGQAGQEYGTAMALIILQMPNRLLPIFQK